MILNKFGQTLEEFFEEKLIGAPDSKSCWLTNFSLDKDGYVQLSFNKKKLKGHRISYQLYKGDIGKGLKVLHSCDNPGCVNPKHLFLGTSKDNTQDMIRKNRNRKSYFKRSPASQELIEKIKLMYIYEGYSKKQIGIILDRPRTSINSILKRALND